MKTLRNLWEDYKLLLRNVPSVVMAVFVLSVVCMNLMASKELYRSEYFCIDCGLTLSWIPFLCMDCICKRFGAKAATQISMTAIAVNILTVIIFKLLTLTPGRWAAYYSAPDAATANMINASLDETFGGAWYVVLGSATAMLISTLVNTSLNQMIGKLADHGGYGGFAARSLISTVVAQWVDNFVFTALVSHVFFGWTWTQVLICTTTSMVLEFAAEALFSPVGYFVSSRWERDNIGKNYIERHQVA